MELKPGNLAPKAVHQSLLIVPYGIETKTENDKIITYLTFNRTLWN